MARAHAGLGLEACRPISRWPVLSAAWRSCVAARGQAAKLMC